MGDAQLRAQSGERLTRATTVSSGAAQRARIVLLAADGVANDQICELVGSARQKVMQWCARDVERGIAGLADQRRQGRPATIDHRKRCMFANGKTMNWETRRTPDGHAWVSDCRDCAQQGNVAAEVLLQ